MTCCIWYRTPTARPLGPNNAGSQVLKVVYTKQTHTHTHTRARAHTRTHAHTNERTNVRLSARPHARTNARTPARLPARPPARPPAARPPAQPHTRTRTRTHTPQPGQRFRRTDQTRRGYSHRSYKRMVKRGLATLAREEWNRRRARKKPAVAGSTEDTSSC